MYSFSLVAMAPTHHTKDCSVDIQSEVQSENDDRPRDQGVSRRVNVSPVSRAFRFISILVSVVSPLAFLMT